VGLTLEQVLEYIKPVLKEQSEGKTKMTAAAVKKALKASPKRDQTVWADEGKTKTTTRKIMKRVNIESKDYRISISRQDADTQKSAGGTRRAKATRKTTRRNK
jgi:hypothetical protein